MSTASLSTPLAPEALPSLRRASQDAHDKLAAKLVALGKLADLTPGQVNVGSRERGGEAHREPATNGQRWEAFELAGQLEAALPDLSGTALCTAAQLTIFLLDPAGATRLGEHLHQARVLLTHWRTRWPSLTYSHQVR